MDKRVTTIYVWRRNWQKGGKQPYFIGENYFVILKP